MLPVLFSIGSVPISSFGVIFALGIIFGIFLIWRLSKAWDLDEEKILDLTLITFLGGFIGSRFYYVISHPEQFSNIFGIFLINKYPGLSFWGAILGGWLTLFFISRFRKMDFLGIGDIASVGFLGSLVFANLGCFFGGCNPGAVSKAFFAVNMVGMVGKRFPVQLIEALFMVFALFSVWSTATRFHTRGKILSLTLIYIGLFKLILQPFRQSMDEGVVLSFVLLILGITMHYKVTKKNPLKDLEAIGTFIVKFFTSSDVRKSVLFSFRKYWYNRKTSVSWKIRNLKKQLRRSNVKFS